MIAVTPAGAGARSVAARPAALDPPAAILAKAGAENFPVASRVLPRRQREHLLAVYGVARLIDDIGDGSGGIGDGSGGIGDGSGGDRRGQLDWAAREIERAYAGGAESPIFVALQATLVEVALPQSAFLDLIEANRQDQEVSRYRSFDDLLGYCALSANPVGRLVLAIFGRSGADLFRWSDSICSGLQLVEHWQDVAEDAGMGRIYLPGEDLDRYGVEESVLTAGVATPALRRLMAFETARARRLILSGAPLVWALRGRPRVALAGFVGGGLAALDAIEAAGYDVLACSPRPGRGRSAHSIVRALAGRSR
jgi:squalene synthase HpnC